MSIQSNKQKPIMRLGVIGLGGATKQMLPSLASHPYVRITAGSDVRAEARERFAADYGAEVYESVEQLCDSSHVDAVYIATPHQWHQTHALTAAERGKHMIVEKPMALTLEACDTMIAAAERNGVYIVVGHTHSFNAPILKMREIIQSGELGPLAMINNWNYSNFLYRPRRPEELRTDLGGGIIYNQVPHQVDMIRLLGGGRVRSVRSMAWILDPDRPTEGSHITFLQFESGAAASMVFSGYDYFDTDEFHFWIGELGEPKPKDKHGKARMALRQIKSSDANAEAALKAANAYGSGSSSSGVYSDASGQWHHPHFGITIATCAYGDLRPSADGVLIYGRQGREEVLLPRGRAFPDKGGVVDEMYHAFANHQEPLHNGRWGMSTLWASADCTVRRKGLPMCRTTNTRSTTST